MSKQWGKGYHTGYQEGFNEGYKKGCINGGIAAALTIVKALNPSIPLDISPIAKPKQRILENK